MVLIIMVPILQGPITTTTTALLLGWEELWEFRPVRLSQSVLWGGNKMSWSISPKTITWPIRWLYWPLNVHCWQTSESAINSGYGNAQVLYRCPCQQKRHSKCGNWSVWERRVERPDNKMSHSFQSSSGATGTSFPMKTDWDSQNHTPFLWSRRDAFLGRFYARASTWFTLMAKLHRPAIDNGYSMGYTGRV